MDIDIDLQPKVDPTKLFRNIISGSRVEEGDLKKHNVGYYFQDIPVDSVTGFAAIPHDKTEDMGYMKIDLLSITLLEHFKSKQEMRDLLKKEPDWTLFHDEAVVKTLFQLGNHFKVVSRVRPTSIQEVADAFALTKPNKRGLLNKYLKNPKKIRVELYTKRAPEDMRMSHAIPYAQLIVLQLHLIKQGRL